MKKVDEIAAVVSSDGYRKGYLLEHYVGEATGTVYRTRGLVVSFVPCSTGDLRDD